RPEVGLGRRGVAQVLAVLTPEIPHVGSTTLANGPVPEELRSLAAHQVGAAFEQGDVDLLAAAGPLASPQRRLDRYHGQRGRVAVHAGEQRVAGLAIGGIEER